VLSFPGANTAVLTLTKVRCYDHFQAFAPAMSLATINLQATWSGTIRRVTFNGTHLGSRFRFAGFQDTVALSISVVSQVSQSDFTPFSAQTSGTGTTVYSEFGTENNGIFA
jgi:hypothetical protein